jgi:hypothetical protein
MNSYSADWATKLYDLAHVHGPYLAASTIIWTAVYLASAPISRRVSATYCGLPFKLKMQWDNRIVAFLHAVIICYAAFWGLLCDEPLKADHLHAYSSWAYATMITACGYFIWDAVMCIIYFKEFQLGFLLHALGCLFTFLGSLDGVFMYYGYFYLTFEASTPFLNLHWFMDKLGVSNSNPFKKLNAGLLVLSFFFFRIISGCGYSAVVWQDIHRYIAATSNMANVGIMYYFYFAILLLNGLNCYWFYSIVKFATRAPKVHPSSTSTSAAATAVTANDKARKKE